MLYNIKPDDYTLDILCRSARLAAKLDSQTLAGNLAMMGLSNPFRRQPQVEPSGRDEVVQMIQWILDKRGKTAMGVWKNAPAFEGVRTAFRQLVLSNWPEMKNIQSPAHAVRLPGSDDGPLAPLTEVAQSIAQSLSSRNIYSREEESPPPYTDLSNPLHTSIVPSESTFYAYILLLGTSSYQHEVPLVLAWMREHCAYTRDRRTLCIAMIFWAEVSLRAAHCSRTGRNGNERSRVPENCVEMDYVLGGARRVSQGLHDCSFSERWICSGKGLRSSWWRRQQEADVFFIAQENS